jgi:hypothetical protein
MQGNPVEPPRALRPGLLSSGFSAGPARAFLRRATARQVRALGRTLFGTPGL